MVTILTLKVWKVSVWKEYRQPFCSEGSPGHVCFLLLLDILVVHRREHALDGPKLRDWQ